MAKKHKHEEHANHERWVISYADMVTLLFALFVVLYALGEVKLAKLKELKQSLAFAFHFEGEGQTQEEGIHSKGDVGGDLLEAAALVNAQKGAMMQFIKETLGPSFQESTGRSLDVVVQDDTIAVRSRLSDFFVRGERYLREDTAPTISQLIEKSAGFAKHIRILIEAPKVDLPRRNADGTLRWSGDLCAERCVYVQLFASYMRHIDLQNIQIEFRYMPDTSRSLGYWEDVGTITIALSNIEPNPSPFKDD